MNAIDSKIFKCTLFPVRVNNVRPLLQSPGLRHSGKQTEI